MAQADLLNERKNIIERQCRDPNPVGLCVPAAHIKNIPFYMAVARKVKSGDVSWLKACTCFQERRLQLLERWRQYKRAGSGIAESMLPIREERKNLFRVVLGSRECWDVIVGIAAYRN